jgi:hypothetical protein
MTGFVERFFCQLPPVFVQEKGWGKTGIFFTWAGENSRNAGPTNV